MVQCCDGGAARVAFRQGGRCHWSLGWGVLEKGGLREGTGPCPAADIREDSTAVNDEPSPSLERQRVTCFHTLSVCWPGTSVILCGSFSGEGGWSRSGRVGVRGPAVGGRERERAEHGREACVWRKPWDSRWKAAGLTKSQNESQLCPSVCISYHLLRN